MLLNWGDKARDGAALLALGQPVGSVGTQPRGGIVGFQALRGIDLETLLDLIGGHGVPGCFLHA
jgi:hypothetical protein